MKVLAATIVAVTVAGGCASDQSDQDALSSKQRAEDIAYDNTGTGLVSTNVQDAIDDVTAMAESHEQRMANAVIVCKFATASLNMPASTTVYPHMFTAAECGGKTPDASYIGSLASYKTCSYEVQGVQVMNAGEADGPGFVITKQWLTNSFTCAGPASLTAIFHKAS